MIEAWILGSFALGTAVGGYMYRGSIRSAVGSAILKELEKGQVIEVREGDDGEMYAAAKIPEDIYIYEDIVDNRLDMAQGILSIMAKHAAEDGDGVIDEETIVGLMDEITEIAHRTIRNRDPIES
jgi:hypothetical protein